LATFDPQSLQDEGIQREFAFLERRARNVAHSVLARYDKPENSVAFRYIDERGYNAYARLERRQYHIELNAAVPLLNLMLFYGLLSDSRFLPDLDSTGMDASNFTVPFFIDPTNFDKRANWQVNCNAIRAFAAGTLADTCNTFVMLHEFGHVLCGHCEGKLHYTGEGTIAELVSIKRPAIADLERDLAWEGDADMVAGALLAQFVEGLVSDIKLNTRTNAVFADPDGFHMENTAAIVVASLFSLFCYIEATRHSLERYSTHPHPQVRALLVKNVLHQQLAERGAFNSEIFHDYLDAHLDDAMIVLESLRLFDPKGYSMGFSKSVDREFARLKILQERYRSDCAQWSWIGWGKK
jgi:hypothetical protein